MQSIQTAHDGSHESCWRVLIDTNGTESGETLLVINAIGSDAMLNEVERQGYSLLQILSYTVC